MTTRRIESESANNYLKAFQEENTVHEISDILMLAELTHIAQKTPFPLDADEIIAEWYDAGKSQPFILVADPSKTIRASLDELFEQARKRQKQNPGNQYLGAVLQHLVGAKLSLILPPGKLQMNGAYVADSPTDRSGDFVINNTVIHCTSAPGEPLIQKCKSNINAGCLPVIITVFDRVKTALDLAADAELNGRIEVWDIQQFLSTNISEHSLFDGAARNTKLADIIEKYNTIIDEFETDPSLRIEFDAK